MAEPNVRMQSEEVLQKKADVLQELMVKALSAALRSATQALGAVLTAAATNPSDPAWTRAEARWMEAVSGEFFPRVVGAYADAAEDIHLQLVDLYDGPADDVPFVTQAEALEYLRGTANRMVRVTEGTWTRARAQLIQGFDAGESIEELSVRLQNVTDWSARRAATVARTEIISASNAGALAEARAVNPEASKVWMATMDARTREWHREADGETVLLDQTFTVGGEELDFPGDPTGSPSNVINCRCTLGVNVPREAVNAAVENLSGLRDVTDEFDPADFVDFDSLTAALVREEFLTRRPFDESKHRRGRGGRFVRKGAPGPVHTARRSKDTDSSEEAAVSAEERLPSPAPAEPIDSAAETETPGITPNVPLVQATDDVIDGLDLDDGIYAEENQRVLVGDRFGTVRTITEDDSGFAGELAIQFDDNPTELETVQADAARGITGADDENVMGEPFSANVVGTSTAESKGPSGEPAEEQSAETTNSPFPVSPGFETLTAADALDMQDEMTEGDPWTVRQEDALIFYSDQGFREMNDCLRSGDECSPDIERNNRQASGAMRPTTRPTTSFRNANLAALGVENREELESLVGAVVTDRGFTSTSVSPDVLNGVPGSVTLQIEIPQGTMAAYIDQVSANGSNSDADPPELELMLDRGTRFEVLEVGRADGRSTVRVRVIP